MTTFATRDERETTVDLAADRLSYLVLAFGLLGVAAWRSFAGESTWDLLGLVVLSGLAGLTYRYRMGVVTRSWATVAVIAAVAAAVVALLMVTGVGR
jgi:hypothetical protein